MTEPERTPRDLEQGEGSAIFTADPEKSNEENGTTNTAALNDTDVDHVCQLALDFGLAAFRYGSRGECVQRFVVDVLKCYGIEHATCVMTQSEIFLCVHTVGTHTRLVTTSSRGDLHHRHSSSSIIRSTSTCRYGNPRMWMVLAPSGNNLDKLSRLAELAKTITNQSSSQDTTSPKPTIQETSQKVQEIETSANPFGILPSFLSWVMLGFALPPILGSTWYDALLGAILAGVNFWISTGIDKLRNNHWLADGQNLILGFVPAFLSQLAKNFWRHDIGTAIVTLAAIALPLPGYGVSLGVIELCCNRIVPGFGHLLEGVVVTVWLSLGAAFGIGIANAIRKPDPITEMPVLVGDIWQILTVPMLCLSLCIAFQNSYRDMGWSITCQLFAYAMSYVGSLLGQSYFGYFVGATAFTLFANIWAIWFNRPNTIILVPAFVLSISGSIGFRGLLNLELGEQELGGQQFLRMLVVALVTLTGILVGTTLIKPRTIL